MSNSTVKFNRSQILKNAHLIKNTEGISFGEAQARAWKEAKGNALSHVLKMGVVEFSFIKADGTLRNALGTMNLDLFTPLFKTDRHSQKEITFNGTVVFWDLEVKEWRSTRVDRIVKIKSLKVINNAVMSIAA